MLLKFNPTEGQIEGADLAASAAFGSGGRWRGGIGGDRGSLVA